MNEPSDQVSYKVNASLPFPLRLEGGPFNIVGNRGKAELSFETVRQTKYDTRLLVESGECDFEIDRHGYASYSRVSANITPNYSAHPIATLIECLNQLIRNLRDMTNCSWLQDLEKEDLYQISVELEGEFTEIASQGRTGGITLPYKDVTSETKERLIQRLSSREQVLGWRLLQLDAENSLNLGRYEEAVVVGWGALEAACRSETPRLARLAGITAAELAQRVIDEPPKNPPFSQEEVAESDMAKIRNLVRVCSELAETAYDPGSLSESIRYAQNLRNVVTHRGIRLSRGQALRALAEIRFVLNALGLPTSRLPEPFDCQSWIEHFGRASVDFQKLLGTREGRLVVFRAKKEKPQEPLSYWFQFERVDNYFIARLLEGIDEEAAAVLVVVTNDSFQYGGEYFPHLSVNAPDFLILGHLNMVAQTTTRAVHWAHAAMIQAQAGLSVQHACDYAVDCIWKGFTRLDHTFDSGHAEFFPLCTKIASYLVHASEMAFERFRHKMAGSHRQISDEVVQIKNILTALDPDDPHSICDALRAIHSRAGWLGNIVVQCPIERAE